MKARLKWIEETNKKIMEMLKQSDFLYKQLTKDI